jgi:flagellar motility protein MotE (MotC chaperone)
MATESDPLDDNWRGSYFNYFTEVEEHFQRARGTALFLLSPLDWALIESWKNAGVPLAAVLRGIDLAFEKWRAKKTKTQAVNSLAYCAQAIATETEAMAKGGPSVASAGSTSHAEDSAPFSKQELASFLEKSIADLRSQQVHEIADAIAKLLSEVDTHYYNLEELEQRLTALEEKMIAQVRSRMPEEDLFAARRELDLQLKPYRSKMNAGQLAMLEKQFLERKILESNNLPRLSLFYLR